MSKRTPSLRATMIALALAGLATGQALGATGSGSTTTATFAMRSVWIRNQV